MKLSSDEILYQRAIRDKSRAKYFRGFTTKKLKATFCCPECGNDVADDLIRLRDGLFECRKCKTPFLKSGIIDEFDFDGIEENI
jgi:ribosomal protein L37AE/L43A